MEQNDNNEDLKRVFHLARTDYDRRFLLSQLLLAMCFPE